MLLRARVIYPTFSIVSAALAPSSSAYTSVTTGEEWPKAPWPRQSRTPAEATRSVVLGNLMGCQPRFLGRTDRQVEARRTAPRVVAPSPITHYTPTTHFEAEILTFLACSCCVICDLANETKFRKIKGRLGFRRRVSACLGRWHARGQGFKFLILHCRFAAIKQEAEKGGRRAHLVARSSSGLLYTPAVQGLDESEAPRASRVLWNCAKARPVSGAPSWESVPPAGY